MTIQVSISGHATGDTPEQQEANEAKFIDSLRDTIHQFTEAGGEVYTANFSSQYHQTGDLK